MSTDYERGFAEAIEKAVEVAELMQVENPSKHHSDVWNMGYSAAIGRLAAAIRTLSPSHDTVRVPREPTEEMLRAGHHAVNGTPPIAGVKALVKSIYRAMIAEVK